MSVTRQQGAIINFMGLSGDSKPTSQVPVGSTFYETDTSNKFVYTGTAWVADSRK